MEYPIVSVPMGSVAGGPLAAAVFGLRMLGKHGASSRTIFREMLSLTDYRRAGAVLAYAGFGGELRRGPFLRMVVRQDKTLVLPR